MSDDGEMWAEIRKQGQEKRASNRISSVQILEKWAQKTNGVIMHFTDAHKRINERFDFWPGTGKYLDRVTGKYRRGVFNLIRELENHARKSA